MAVAAMVAAPVLLPAAEYLPKTLRAARMREPVAALGPLPARASSPRPTFPSPLPTPIGNSRFADYWGLANTNEDAGGFVGTAMLLAALLALRARRRFPAGAAGAGDRRRLPAADRSRCSPRCSHRLLLPLSLCLAYLGACTLERFQRGEVRRWPLLLVAAALAAVLAWGYLAHPDPRDPARLAIFRFGWLRWQLRFLALAALLLAVTASWRRPARSLAVAGVAAAILAELLLLHRPANPPMPRRLALPVNGPLAFLARKNPRGPGSDGRVRPRLPAQPGGALRAGGRADLQPHGAAGLRRADRADRLRLVGRDPDARRARPSPLRPARRALPPGRPGRASSRRPSNGSSRTRTAPSGSSPRARARLFLDGGPGVGSARHPASRARGSPPRPRLGMPSGSARASTRTAAGGCW